MLQIKTIVFFIILAVLVKCGQNNLEEKNQKATKIMDKIKNLAFDSVFSEKRDTLNSYETTTSKENDIQNKKYKSTKNDNLKKKITTPPSHPIHTHINPISKKEEMTSETPIRNLLKNGEVGKTYNKKELIENFKFTKEAVTIIKQITYLGPNKLHFKWGSTWFIEKVSDAKLRNGTMTFVFKQNKTYISGDALGIKYNKKIFTDLILVNGAAYIPSVKGYHWEIKK